MALVGDVYCIVVTFTCGILGQVHVRYLIVSFPYLCRLSYFYSWFMMCHCHNKLLFGMHKLLCVRACVRAGGCVFKFSETTGPTEAKFHVAPPWHRGKDEKLIQMI